MNKLIDQEPRLPKGYIVILATLPIWGEAISVGICLALAKGNSNLAWEYHAHIAWFLPYLFINGILCMLDADRLQKNNLDLSYLWGIILPPLYLFLRGRRVAKAKGESLIRNQVFTLIWLISLIVAAFSLGYLEEKYTDVSSREIQVEPSTKVTEALKQAETTPPVGIWKSEDGKLIHQLSLDSYQIKSKEDSSVCKWYTAISGRESIQGCAAVSSPEIKSGADLRSDYLSRLIAEGIKGSELEEIQKDVAKIKDGRYQEIQVVYAESSGDCGHVIYVNKDTLLHVIDCLVTGNSMTVTVLSSK